MMRYTLIAIVLMSVSFISGCNLISPDPAAVMPVDIPDDYVHKTGIDTPQTGKENMDGEWWQQFGVDELSQLIQTGLGANYDLKDIVLAAGLQKPFMLIDIQNAGHADHFKRPVGQSARNHTRTPFPNPDPDGRHGSDSA